MQDRGGGQTRGFPIFIGRAIDGARFVGCTARDVFALCTNDDRQAAYAHRTMQAAFVANGEPVVCIQRPEKASPRGTLPSVFDKFVRTPTTFTPFEGAVAHVSTRGRSPPCIALQHIPLALKLVSESKLGQKSMLDFHDAILALAGSMYMALAVTSVELELAIENAVKDCLACCYSTLPSIVPYALEVDADDDDENFFSV